MNRVICICEPRKRDANKVAADAKAAADAKTAADAKMTADITSLLGLSDETSPPGFVSHQSAFKKASKVNKYFLVELCPRGLPFDSQATSLQPRSKVDTTERKAIKKEKKVSMNYD